MTSTMWELYWLTRVINIHDCSGIIWGLLLCTMIIGTLATLISSIDSGKGHVEKWLGRVGIFLGIPWLLVGLLFVFTPTKEEAAFIVAGGAVVMAAQSDAGQKIAQKSVAVLEGSLDNILGKEAVAKAQLDVEKKVVDAVKNQMGIKDDGKGTNSPAPSGS
jgi:hypothetical protein